MLKFHHVYTIYGLNTSTNLQGIHCKMLFCEMLWRRNKLELICNTLLVYSGFEAEVCNCRAKGEHQLRKCWDNRMG